MKKEHFEAFLSENYEDFEVHYGDVLKPRICHLLQDDERASKRRREADRQVMETTKMGYSRDRSMLNICNSKFQPSFLLAGHFFF